MGHNELLIILIGNKGKKSFLSDLLISKKMPFFFCHEMCVNESAHEFIKSFKLKH